MTYTMIAAHSSNGILDNDGKLPWHVPDDMKRFKAWTIGKAVLMGRLTHESIGKPLPNRSNLILSRNPAYQRPGTVTVHTIAEAQLYAKAVSQELVIIGGKQVYELALPHASHMILTEIVGDFEGGVPMFEFDRAQWTLEQETHYDSEPHNTIVRSWIRKEKLS